MNFWERPALQLITTPTPAANPKAAAFFRSESTTKNQHLIPANRDIQYQGESHFSLTNA
jgi:hypothetical protein